MADLLQIGSTWLEGQRHAHISRPVTYIRGAGSVQLQATVGRTVFDQEDQFGVLHRTETRDYLVRSADLAFADGIRTLPRVGDRIREPKGVADVTPLLLFQTAQDINTGGAAWSTPEGALVQDFASAQSGPIGLSGPSTNITNRLRLSNALIAPAVPVIGTLLGVEVEVFGRWSGATSGVRSVSVDSQVGGVLRKSLGVGALPVSASVLGSFLMGGPADTIGVSKADVLDPAFGFRLTGTSTTVDAGGNTLHIDVVRWRFHWDTGVTTDLEHGTGVSFYEVMAIGAEPPFRYSDPDRLTLRIHTKFVGPEATS